jgi:phage terminase small subunit
MPKNPKISDDKLSEKELTFCYEYIAHRFNGTRAAIAAGYSEKTAKEQAYDILTRPHIKAKIKELSQKHLQKINYNAESVLNELAILGFNTMKDFVDEDENGNVVLKSLNDIGDNARAIQQLEMTNTTRSYKESDEVEKEQKIKFKLYDKKASLELIGKNLQLFTDKFKFDGKIENAVQIFIPDNGRNKTD